MCGRVMTSVKLCWRLILRCIQATSLHTHRHSPSPAEPASWLPSSLIPGCPAGFFCGVAAPPTSTSRLFGVPSPKFTRAHRSTYWRSCLSDVPYPWPPSPTWVQFSVNIQLCRSASHPMRQTAEKEGETNQLRSSCTLHRRQEWCQ